MRACGPASSTPGVISDWAPHLSVSHSPHGVEFFSLLSQSLQSADMAVTLVSPPRILVPREEFPDSSEAYLRVRGY